jgi:SAM-dependent methyltransferase
MATQDPLRWDRRYAAETYAFGTEPNDFLVEVAPLIPAGRVLCLAEGEGRNAVWLAGQGHEVTAVDASTVGIAKAQALARARGVEIVTVAADLSDYTIEPGFWAGIVAIFAHLPPALRRAVHRGAAAGLVPGGVFVLEAFAPAQMAYGTGGPSQLELLYQLGDLRDDLASLEIVIGRELEREILEGVYHTGLSAVVQVLARQPEFESRRSG